MTEQVITSAGHIERPTTQRPRTTLLLILAIGIPFLGLTAVCAWLMNRYTLDVPIAAAVSIALVVLCFIRAKWVLYVLVFACLFSPQLSITETLGRAAKRPVTLRIEDILIVVLGFAWLARTAIHKELSLLLRTPLNRPILAYVLICITATAAGIAYGWVVPQERLAAALFVLKYIQYFVLFFIVLHHIDSPQDVRNLVIAGIVTYLLVCAYGYYQLYGLAEGARPSTFGEKYGEPNTLAGYLLFMLGICSGLLLVAKDPSIKVAWGFFCVLGLVLLAFTLSRSGWAGLFGIIAVLIFFGRHKLAVVATLSAIAAILILVSLNINWLPDSIETRLAETGGTFETLAWAPPVEILGWKLDPSASERVRSYQDALGTWASRTSEYWLPLLTGSGVLGGRPFVDGQYVRVLAETGLLGLAAFLVLLAAIWRDVRRTYRTVQTPWYKGLALGYLAGFAGLLVHALGANTFIIVRIMEPFFIFTGVVMLLPAMEAHKIAHDAELKEQEERIENVNARREQ